MWKYERRERKLESRKKRIPKHSKELGELYANAILKRAKVKHRKSRGNSGLTKQSPDANIEED